MRQLLLDNFHAYPLMQPQDCVKLLYQSHFGCGHFVADPPQALARLQTEYRPCPHTDAPLFEPLGGGYCRLNLSALDEADLSLDTLCRLFIYSSGQQVSGRDSFLADLALLDAMVQQRQLPLDAAQWAHFLAQYRADGYPAVSHSSAYREAYHPAYRVLHQSCQNDWPVLTAIDRLLRQQGGGAIAIDGGSGTGKSHLAGMLAAVFPASVVHMDDFFLQGFQRTPQRLAEPGGNLDYERFLAQVVPYLGTEDAFSYDIFDCSCGKLSGKQAVAPLPLRIVEGVYSQHPKWSGQFDLKVFLTADRAIRLKRIEARSGSFLLKRFQEEWIPKEDLYFDTFSIPRLADLAIDTGTFF
ncbi:MAG: hypothetical protein PHE47_01415 [Oscillospiraceae bacterium]|nr:hypothetical protein [Oscillospiraceae bacterium]